MEKEYFYQTEIISYSNGQAAGSLYKEITMDSAYERCVGIAIIESKSGGISSYRIGVDDKDKQYISAVHKNLLISDTAAGMNIENRFLPVNIKAGGHKIKIATVLPSMLSADLEYDVVLRLERDKQKY